MPSITLTEAGSPLEALGRARAAWERVQWQLQLFNEACGPADDADMNEKADERARERGQTI